MYNKKKMSSFDRAVLDLNFYFVAMSHDAYVDFCQRQLTENVRPFCVDNMLQNEFSISIE